MLNNESTAKVRYHAPVLGRRSHHENFAFYGDLVANGNRRLALDGVGIIGEKLVTKNDDLIEIEDNFDCMAIKGSVAVYTELIDDKTSFFKINPDPIGACLVYKYEKNGVIAFSSDLKHLVDWLIGQNIQVKKSVFYQALLLSINDGAFGYSSYEDIYTLNSSEYIIAHGNKYRIANYGVEEFLKSEGSYHELLDLTQADIEKTLYAISSSRFEKIAHLTGGMDSRLVVSAISSANILRDFKIFCSGQKGLPDFDTAYSLCSVLNARMTNKPSLIQSKIPKDFEEYYKWSSDDNQGMLPNQPTNVGILGNKQTIVLSGGYGECLRGYHQHIRGYSLQSTIDNLWPLHDAQGNVRSLATESVIHEIKSELGSYLVSKLVKGWTLNDALQLIYLQEKNRYFVGNISLSFSRHTPRIDPLYSLFGFKAAYKLDHEDRANRLLMFELMERFNKKLTVLKFGTTSWPEALIKQKNIKIDMLPEGRDVEFERHESSNNILWLNEVSHESKLEAIRLGAPVW